MLRGFFALILTVLLFTSSLGLVFHKLGDAKFLNEQAREINVYGRLFNVDNLKPLLDQSELTNSGLESEEIVEVIKQAIDGEKFYGFLNSYLTSTLDYITGKNDDPSYSYDLTAIKDGGSNALAAKMIVEYQNLPICQGAELRTWDIDENLPNCQLPSGMTKANDTDRQITNLAKTQIESLPNAISRNKASPTLANYRMRTLQAYTLIKFTWIITVIYVLLFLIINRRKAFWSMAGSFLLVGIFEVGFSLIAWDWIGKNIADIATSGETESLAPLITDFATSILEVFRTIFGNISILFLAIGVFMLILGFIFKAKPQNNSTKVILK